MDDTFCLYRGDERCQKIFIMCQTCLPFSLLVVRSEEEPYGRLASRWCTRLEPTGGPGESGGRAWRHGLVGLNVGLQNTGAGQADRRAQRIWGTVLAMWASGLRRGLQSAGEGLTVLWEPFGVSLDRGLLKTFSGPYRSPLISLNNQKVCPLEFLCAAGFGAPLGLYKTSQALQEVCYVICPSKPYDLEKIPRRN